MPLPHTLKNVCDGREGGGGRPNRLHGDIVARPRRLIGTHIHPFHPSIHQHTCPFVLPAISSPQKNRQASEVSRTGTLCPPTHRMPETSAGGKRKRESRRRPKVKEKRQRRTMACSRTRNVSSTRSAHRRSTLQPPLVLVEETTGEGHRRCHPPTHPPARTHAHGSSGRQRPPPVHSLPPFLTPKPTLHPLPIHRQVKKKSHSFIGAHTAPPTAKGMLFALCPPASKDQAR